MKFSGTVFFLPVEFCYYTEMIPLLLENDEIIVVDKPAGLAAQPGEGVRDDVVALLERQLGYRPFPVNRLDKETAGCMILAKDGRAAGRWSGLIATRDVKKRYYAWASGQPRREKGDIDDVLDGGKGAQEARTLWSLKETWEFAAEEPETFADRQFAEARGDLVTVSLLELELKTGRMHQIRRHLAGIGLPVLGDDRHGDFSLNRILRHVGVKRLMLWARELMLPAQPGLPGGASILSGEPPHFAAFRAFLMRSGTPRRAPRSGRPEMGAL